MKITKNTYYMAQTSTLVGIFCLHNFLFIIVISILMLLSGGFFDILQCIFKMS